MRNNEPSVGRHHYKTFEEEVCGRLSRLEANQNAVVKRLDWFIDGDCKVRGCDLSVGYTELQTKQDSLYTLVKVVGAAIVTTTITLIGTIIYSGIIGG